MVGAKWEEKRCGVIGGVIGVVGGSTSFSVPDNQAPPDNSPKL